MQKIKIYFMQILKLYSMVSYASFLIYRGIILFIGTPLLPLPVFSTSSFFFFFLRNDRTSWSIWQYGNEFS